MALISRVSFFLGLIWFILGPLGPVSAMEPIPAQTRSGEAQCQAAGLGEAKALALKAAKLLRAAGPKRAFRRFSDPDDAFIDRDLYVFILDLNGRIWFNAVFPVAPGSNILGSRDSSGRYFVQDMVTTARNEGEGWVEYEWLSPCTGEMAPKSAYVVRVGPLLVAVGAYGVVSL
jgi:cytochrome c